MGSLAYVAGGALAGAGAAGMAVGTEAMKHIEQEGLLRLQKQYAEEMQQRGFSQQKELQEQQQTFSAGQQKQALQARGAIASAEMAQKERLAGEHEKESTRRTGMIVKGRESVAQTAADSRRDVAEAKAKDSATKWTKDNITITKYENGVPVTRQIPLWLDPKSHQQYVQVAGGKLVKWNADTGAPDRDEKSLSRVQPSQQDLQSVIQRPDDVIPSAFAKGGGLTNRQFFEQEYGFLPPGIVQSGPSAKSMMSDESAPQSEGSQAAEDAQDQSVAEGGAPNNMAYGQPYSPPNVSIPAHQASDDEAAQ